VILIWEPAPHALRPKRFTSTLFGPEPTSRTD
jgi:hypothetical protein